MLTQQNTAKTQFKYIMLCCLNNQHHYLLSFLYRGVAVLYFHFMLRTTGTMNTAILLHSLLPLRKTEQPWHFPTTPDSPKALPRSRMHAGVRTYSLPVREHELSNQF